MDKVKVHKNIDQKDFFEEQCPFRSLHFFQNDENVVNFISLEEQSYCERTKISISFRIPEFHKSIATPDGSIFLIGGTWHRCNQKSNEIFQYDFKGNTLIRVARLFNARSSHSLSLSGNGRYIYILGGIGSDGSVTNSCERFDTQTFRVEEIGRLNLPVCSFASCSFNERYICKFGGVTGDKSLVHTMVVWH